MLGDIPILSTVKRTAQAFFGNEWQKTILSVTHLCNANQAWYCNLVFQGMRSECYEFDEVENVLACYIGLIKNGSDPEYSPELFYEAQLTKISRCSGTNPVKCKAILTELYKQTENGTIKNGQYLRPRSYDKYRDYREVEQEGDTDIFTTAFDLAKALLLLGAVGLGVYTVSKFKH